MLLLLYWPLGAFIAHAATFLSSLFLLFPTFFSVAILRQPENPAPPQVRHSGHRRPTRQSEHSHRLHAIPLTHYPF